MNRGITTDQAVLAADASGRVPPELSLAWLDESRDRFAIAAIIGAAGLAALVVGGSRVFSTSGRSTSSDSLSATTTNETGNSKRWFERSKEDRLGLLSLVCSGS